MKKALSLVLSITLFASASVWAGVADTSNAAAHTTAIPLPSLTPKVTDEDMAQLFEVDGKPLQLAKLSTLEMKETEGAWIPFLVATFHAINYTRYAVGPINAWVRMGPSFSQTSQVATNAIRWGSNNHYQQQIGSVTLRNVNNSLHNSRLPGSTWRVQDSGHFHLGRR